MILFYLILPFLRMALNFFWTFPTFIILLYQDSKLFSEMEPYFTTPDILFFNQFIPRQLLLWESQIWSQIELQTGPLCLVQNSNFLQKTLIFVGLKNGVERSVFSKATFSAQLDILFWSERLAWAVTKLSVHYSFFLSSCVNFLPEGGYRRILKFCMGC